MEHHQNPDRLIFKLLYIVKRFTDKASTVALASLISADFNMTFMPYFMSIGQEGISNHDLVNRIMVTKQAVSKTVKELERLGLVYTGKSETDARSIMIYFTADGKKLFDAVCEMADDLTDDYIKLVGAKRYEQFIDTFMKIAEYHKSQDL